MAGTPQLRCANWLTVGEFQPACNDQVAQMFKLRYILLFILFYFHTSLSAGDDQDHFRNWKELRDSGIEKQDLDVSCGSAAAATILNGYYGVAVSEPEILVSEHAAGSIKTWISIRRLFY